MGPDDLKMLRETYRLAQENNRMLHKIRRSAFIHSVIWIVVYGALIFAPIWFYLSYLQAPVQQMIKSYAQIASTGAQIHNQYQGFNQSVVNFLTKLPGATSASTTSNKQ